MPTSRRKKISISMLIPFLICSLFLSILFWQKYRSSHEIITITLPQAPEWRRSVTLFFADDGTRLARESRDIDPCDTDAACLKSVVDELLNGPVGDLEEVLPEGTVVTTVYIEGSQVTIDFNRTFADAMLSGSSAEMLAVYSVVNTIATNFPSVQQVKITVDANSDTKLRHLDLSDPLTPDYSLEQIIPESNRDSGGLTKSP